MNDYKFDLSEANSSSEVSTTYENKIKSIISKILIGLATIGMIFLGGMAAHEIYNTAHPNYTFSEAIVIQKSQYQEPIFIWGKQFSKMNFTYKNIDKMESKFRVALNEKQINEFNSYSNKLNNFFLRLALSMSVEDDKEIKGKQISAIKIVPPNENYKKGYLIIDYDKFGGKTHKGITRKIPFYANSDYMEDMIEIIKSTYNYIKLYSLITEKETKAHN